VKVAEPVVAKESEVARIWHWSSARASTVVIGLQRSVRYEAYCLNNPDRVYFDFNDTV